MRAAAAAVSCLVIGGCTECKEKGALKSIERLTIVKESNGTSVISRAFGDMAVSRRSPSCFLSNDKLIVAGGCRMEGDHLASAEVVDIESGVVETVLDDVVIPHSCASVCPFQDDCIVVGGYDGFDCLKQISRISLHNDKPKSEQLRNLPSRLKNGSGVVVDKDTILVFGGWDENDTMKVVYRINVLDKESLDVSMEAVLPFRMEGHGAAMHDGVVFLTGGYDGISVGNRIIRYDIDKKRAEELPIVLNTARENHVSVVLGDRFLLVIGGWDGAKALDSIELFEILPEDPFLKPMNCETRLLTPRNRPAIVSL